MFCDNDQDDTDATEEIPHKLRFLKHNRPESSRVDEETHAYTDLCTAQLRNLKPDIKKQYSKNNNLTPELQSSLKKMTTLAKEGKHVFCRSDKDGKIVIITREDFEVIMNRELEKDKHADLTPDSIDDHLQTIKSCIEEKVCNLHTAGAISDTMIRHTTGMYPGINGNYTQVK